MGDVVGEDDFYSEAHRLIFATSISWSARASRSTW